MGQMDASARTKSADRVAFGFLAPGPHKPDTCADCLCVSEFCFKPRQERIEVAQRTEIGRLHPRAQTAEDADCRRYRTSIS